MAIAFRKYILGVCVVLACVLHVGLKPVSLSRSYIQETLASKSIELLDIEELLPVVRTEKNEGPPQEFSAPKLRAAETDNQVDREQQARLSGTFQSPGPLLPTDPEWGTSLIPSLSELARSPYHLEGVDLGDLNSLNTKKVPYASFMNRVIDQVYNSWASKNQEIVERYGRKLNPKNYVSKTQVILNEEGEVVEIKTLKSSGFEDFDKAFRDAFWEAEKFPNPPKILFKEGHLSLIIGSTVTLEDKSFFQKLFF